MGGFGSGRKGGYPTAEGCASYVLTVRPFKSVPYGKACKGKGTWTWGNEGFALDYELDAVTDPLSPVLRVTHPIRADNERLINYPIFLTSTPTQFLGRRWWFLCPRSGRLAFKLFLPNGGHRFWSRAAYGLGYACQRETRTDRLMRKARRLNVALGGNGGAIGDPPPRKPKWMRWKTWEREYSAWAEADQRADDAWIAEGMMRFGGLL